MHDRDPVKSVSHETTFFEDQTDRELLLSTLLKLSEQVSTRLRKQHLRGKTVQLKLRYSDFTTFTRARTLPQPTCLSGEIYDVAVKLFEEFNNGRAVRLIGVGVSHLQSDAETQLTLWDEDKKRIEKLENLMDSLQEKYGKNVITHAQTLAAKPKKTPPAPENH